MNAKEFLSEYIKNTDKNKTDNSGRTYFEIYKKDSEFTELVNKHIIHDIVEKAGYTPQHEYFRIDTVGWESHYEDMKEAAKREGIKINAHLWDLKIAVEHENSKTDWSDELMKLIHIKCPLKVVIGYSYSDERGEMEERKLKFLAKWMQEIKALQKGEDEEYLVIIGNGCNSKTGISDYDDFGYKGYLYDWGTKMFDEI